ncbi:MAG TPA: rRNA maturation RNase YbeY [Calditrichia bacterium]|nr:rRNA maturation RNase YbeY [Calditrichia bacterium]HQV30335.1 rRNA maturation RNase YbeY [Calditrichia bacterium]
MSPVEVFYQDAPFEVDAEQAIALAGDVIDGEQLAVENINIIFVNDAFLQDMHRDYLDDDTPTDIITFNLSEDEDNIPVEGELYISLDRAQEFAGQNGIDLTAEIARLVIHGILHLKGYDDRTPEDRQAMRQREDHYLGRNPKGISPLK